MAISVLQNGEDKTVNETRVRTVKSWHLQHTKQAEYEISYSRENGPNTPANLTTDEPCTVKTGEENDPLHPTDVPTLPVPRDAHHADYDPHSDDDEALYTYAAPL